MASNFGIGPEWGFLGKSVRLFHGTVAPSLDVEFSAFDELGPKARDALASAVTRFSAAEIAAVLRAGGHDCRFPPIDAALAKVIEFADAYMIKRGLS